MIKIHREGRLIVGVTLLVLTGLNTLVVLYLPEVWNTPAVLLSFLLITGIMRFFRVPRRRPFLDEKTITAPADGKVVAIEKVTADEFMKGPCIQVSIFMSVHDVHINYYPIDGTVAYNRYHPGRYLVARHPKSSELNERFSTGIVTPFGALLVRQVAGYVARRIRCYASEDTPARQGREMGFIKFGSRVDLLLPPDLKLQVTHSQKVIGGVTPVARFK